MDWPSQRVHLQTCMQFNRCGQDLRRSTDCGGGGGRAGRHVKLLTDSTGEGGVDLFTIHLSTEGQTQIAVK